MRLDAEYGEILGLPLLPVAAADEQLRRRAEATMREIVLRRLEVAGTSAEDVFAPADEVLALLVALSGGHLYSLFLLIRTAIESSDLSAPLTLDHVGWTADRLAATYLDPLDRTERNLLVTVHETKDKPDADAGLELFYSLLRSQYVLAYAAGGDRWYDENPLHPEPGGVAVTGLVAVSGTAAADNEVELRSLRTTMGLANRFALGVVASDSPRLLRGRRRPSHRL